MFVASVFYLGRCMPVVTDKVICELFIDSLFKPFALRVVNHSSDNAVCGAMSSLILSTLNSIEHLIGIKQVYHISSGNVSIMFNSIYQHDESGCRMFCVLLANLVIAISSINEAYPDELSFYIRPSGAFESKDIINHVF